MSRCSAFATDAVRLLKAEGWLWAACRGIAVSSAGPVGSAALMRESTIGSESNSRSRGDPSFEFTRKRDLDQHRMSPCQSFRNQVGRVMHGLGALGRHAERA